MNLTRALNVALPDLPARLIAQRCPRLHPEAVHKEHIVDGRPTVRILIPGVDTIFNLSPQTWNLVRFFDGQRNYEEVEEAYFRETGIRVSLEELHELADDLGLRVHRAPAPADPMPVEKTQGVLLAHQGVGQLELRTAL